MYAIALLITILLSGAIAQPLPPLPDSLFPPSGWQDLPEAALRQPVLTIDVSTVGLRADDTTASLPRTINRILQQHKERPIEIRIPAGTFFLDTALVIRESGVYLRGAGADKTTLHITAPARHKSTGAIELIGGSYQPEIPLVATPQRGTNSVTISAKECAAFSPGDYIALHETTAKVLPLKNRQTRANGTQYDELRPPYTGWYDNNRIQYFWGKNWGSRIGKLGTIQQAGVIYKQLFKVVEITDSTLHLDMKHSLRYEDSAPLFISKYTPIRNVHLADFSIEWPYNWVQNPELFKGTTSEGIWANHISYNIYLKNSADCHIRGVISTKAHYAHLQMEGAKECRISGCTFRQIKALAFHSADNYLLYGGNGASERGYGLKIEGGATGNVIENNNLYNLRHHITLQGGANHNVISYNSLSASRGALHTICLHGNYPHHNLFEGNMLKDGHADYIHSSNGPGNTWFRNFTIYNETLSSLRSLSLGVYVALGKELNRKPESNGNVSVIGNLVGNVERDGAPMVVSSNAILAGSSRYDNEAKQLHLTVQRIERALEHALPASLYRSNKPAFLPADAPWPLWGADLPDGGIRNSLPTLPYAIEVQGNLRP